MPLNSPVFCCRIKRGIGRISALHFKSFNDSAGHQAGDVCLKRVASIVQSELRDYADDVFRFGGEEFIVLLRRANLPTAIQVAERIRRAVEDASIPHPAMELRGVVTVSLGGASATLSREIRVGLVIAAADAVLYSAKQSSGAEVTDRRDRRVSRPKGPRNLKVRFEHFRINNPHFAGSRPCRNDS